MAETAITEDQVELFLQSLKAADADKKTVLVQQWTQRLIDQPVVPERAINAFTLAVGPLLRSSSQQLLIASLGFARTFLHTVPIGAPSDQLQVRLALVQCLSPLIDRLGDAKDKVHQPAAECVMILARKAYEFEAAHGKEKDGVASLWETAIKDALAGKNARIKVEVCKLLARLRSERPTKVPLKPWLSGLVNILEDSDGSVRDQARETVVELLSPAAVPAAARSELKKLMMQRGVRRSIADTIISRVLGGPPAPSSLPATPSVLSRSRNTTAQRNDASPPSHPAPAEPDAAINQSTASTARSGAPTPAEDVKVVYVASANDLQSEFRTMLPHFQGKETEHNWHAREKALTRMRGMLRGRVFTQLPDAFVAELKGGMMEGISKTLLSLRTTLAQQACALVQELAEYIGSALDPFVEHLLVVLGKMAGFTKRIIAEKSQRAVTAIITHTTVPPRVLITHVTQGTQDKNVQARQYGMGHLKTYLETQAPSHTHVIEGQHLLSEIEQTIKRCLGDMNPQVRETARATFWSFHKVWPHQATAILNSLDGSARKQLEKANPAQSATGSSSLASSIRSTPGKARVSSARSAIMAAKRARAAELAAGRVTPSDGFVELPTSEASAPMQVDPPASDAGSLPTEMAFLGAPQIQPQLPLESSQEPPNDVIILDSHHDTPVVPVVGDSTLGLSPTGDIAPDVAMSSHPDEALADGIDHLQLESKPAVDTDKRSPTVEDNKRTARVAELPSPAPAKKAAPGDSSKSSPSVRYGKLPARRGPLAPETPASAPSKAQRGSDRVGSSNHRPALERKGSTSSHTRSVSGKSGTTRSDRRLSGLSAASFGARQTPRSTPSAMPVPEKPHTSSVSSRSSGMARTLSHSPPTLIDSIQHQFHAGAAGTESSGTSAGGPNLRTPTQQRLPLPVFLAQEAPRLYDESPLQSRRISQTFSSSDVRRLSWQHDVPTDPADEARRAQIAQGLSAAQQLLDFDDDQLDLVTQPITPIRVPNRPMRTPSAVQSQQNGSSRRQIWEDSPQAMTPKLLDQLKRRRFERGWWQTRQSLLDKASPLRDVVDEGSHSSVVIQPDVDALVGGNPSIRNLQKIALFSTSNAISLEYDPNDEIDQADFDDQKRVWETDRLFDKVFDGLMSFLDPSRPVQDLEQGLVTLWELVQNQWTMCESREDALLDTLFKLRSSSNAIILESTNSLISLLTEVCDPPFLLLLLNSALDRYINSVSPEEPESESQSAPDGNGQPPVPGYPTPYQVTGDRARTSGYNFGLNAMGMCILHLPREAVAAEAKRLERHVMAALRLSSPETVLARQAAHRVILAIQCQLCDDVQTLALFPFLDAGQRSFVTYLMQQNGVMSSGGAPPAGAASSAEQATRRQVVLDDLVGGMAKGTRIR